MANSEAARNDLYNGLVDVLGTQRAETLMAALPGYDISELATKNDLGVLGARLDAVETSLMARVDGLEVGLGARIDGLEASFTARMDGLEARMGGLEGRMASIESIVGGLGLRMDRMFLAMIAGLFVIVATMAGVLLTL